MQPQCLATVDLTDDQVRVVVHALDAWAKHLDYARRTSITPWMENSAIWHERVTTVHLAQLLRKCANVAVLMRT
jgi:hypothetical protein